MPAGWAAAAAAVVGAVASDDASRHASNSQADAARDANATQAGMAAQSRNDNAPWLNRGNLAGSQLQRGLGLGSNFSGMTPAQARQASLDRFAQGYGIKDWASQQAGNFDEATRTQAYDQAALDMQQAGQSNGGQFGDLTRKFSQADLANDVPYQTGMQFGLDQGVQGLTRQAAATGSLNSGATLKALTQFGNDYGNQQAGAAYNRFTNDQNNQYNKLAGVSGTGQVANQQIGAAGMNAANNISQNQIGAGNARAASSLYSNNALTSGMNSAINGYQSQQYINALRQRNNGGGNSAFNTGSSADYANNNWIAD